MNRDADNNFKVITAALSSFGKLVIIKSKFIKNPTIFDFKSVN